MEIHLFPDDELLPLTVREPNDLVVTSLRQCSNPFGAYGKVVMAKSIIPKYQSPGGEDCMMIP